jgi:hypothetical protein
MLLGCRLLLVAEGGEASIGTVPCSACADQIYSRAASFMEACFGASLRGFGTSNIDIEHAFGRACKNGPAIFMEFEETATHDEPLRFATDFVAEHPGNERGNDRGVIEKDREGTHLARSGEFIDFSTEEFASGSYNLKLKRFGHDVLQI